MQVNRPVGPSYPLSGHGVSCIGLLVLRGAGSPGRRRSLPCTEVSMYLSIGLRLSREPVQLTSLNI